MVSMGMMCCMRKRGIPTEKYLIRTLESLMSAQVIWFWNSEIYTNGSRRGSMLVLFQNHSLDGEPSNGGTSNISLFEGFVELSYEV